MELTVNVQIYLLAKFKAFLSKLELLARTLKFIAF